MTRTIKHDQLVVKTVSAGVQHLVCISLFVKFFSNCFSQQTVTTISKYRHWLCTTPTAHLTYSGYNTKNTTTIGDIDLPPTIRRLQFDTSISPEIREDAIGLLDAAVELFLAGKLTLSTSAVIASSSKQPGDRSSNNRKRKAIKEAVKDGRIVKLPINYIIPGAIIVSDN